MDRNVFGFGAKLVHSLSLSARRAWIEISSSGVDFAHDWVALRKESVDRNGGLMSVVRFATGRSPQGERG